MQISRAIPGLHVFHSFLKNDKVVQEKAINLQKAILQSSSMGSLQSDRTYLSRYHNLKSSEQYSLVTVADESGHKITALYFKKYGEEGHHLTYFIGNNNIPGFIRNDLITRVSRIPQVSALGDRLNWNFTLNTYAVAGERMAGFDYHKDVASNGEISLIYSLGAPSVFQIRHPEQKHLFKSMTLHPNMLIVLSQEARWDYEHRVVPVKVEHHSPLANAIGRISLVLGCSKDPKGVSEEFIEDLYVPAKEDVPRAVRLDEETPSLNELETW